jgi:hypothetical protein
MATTLEIVRGLHQAAANAYDGSHHERYALDGEPRKVGLRREVGDPIIDSRVMDGFFIKIKGNVLCVYYQTDVKLDQMMDKSFPDQVASIMADIVKFLKKEYKAITKSSVSLKSKGDVHIEGQNISRIRNSVTAYQEFEITSMKDVVPAGEPSQDITRDVTRKFLAMGRQSAKKSQNDTRKAEKKDD